MAFISLRARGGLITHTVQQLGGMGVTESLRIGHYFKRLLVIDAQIGNSDYHLPCLAG